MSQQYRKTSHTVSLINIKFRKSYGINSSGIVVTLEIFDEVTVT